LPPGLGAVGQSWVEMNSSGQPTADTFGTVFLHLLPYVEQGTLYNAMVNTSGPYKGLRWPPYNNLFNQPVKVYVCPSDPSVDPSGTGTDDEMTASGGVDYKVWGASSYAANVQVFCRVTETGHYDWEPNALTAPEGHPQFASSFRDGTSNTILFAEKYGRC